MAGPADGPPVIVLPERFDRRLRLGPFPSARDALKFLTYAAVGALLAPFTSPFLWLGVVGAGFALVVARVDGQPVDERAVAFLLWKLRSRAGEVAVTHRSSGPIARHGVLGVSPGRYLAVLRTGGTPMAYLPPSELGRRFELFRGLLRSLDAALGILVTTAPMRARLVQPSPVPRDRPDHDASAGYSELVGLLCRRRQVRQVDLVLASEKVGPDGISDLEVRVRSLAERLAALGVRTVRLRDGALEDAVRRGGWAWPPSGS